jgi:uncharacterized protein
MAEGVVEDVLSRPIDGEWAGVLTGDGRREFVYLKVEDGRAVIDRPNNFHFNLPVALSISLPDIHFAFDALLLEGRLDGQVIAGWVQGAAEGSFELHHVQALAEEALGAMIGHYELFPGGMISLGRDYRPEGKLHFYQEGEEITRLHPIGPADFLSERCEKVHIDAADDEQTTSLTVVKRGSPPITGRRIEWCVEEQIVIPIQDYHIAGTLIRPQGDGLQPTVMLCHHANTHLRDYYRLFAEPFVEAGIASFIYDKRGRGQSGGQPLFSEITQLADDATTIFRFLQGHPQVDPSSLGIWGISNGAWVAVLAGSRVAPAFVISASPACVTPARQEQIRRTNVIRQLGASERAVRLIDQFWGLMFEFVVSGRWSEVLESTLKAVYADEELQRLPKYPGHGPGLQPVPPVVPIEQIKAEEGGAWPDGGFDPVPLYAGLNCPLLFIWGDQDTVVPVEESIARTAEALKSSQHPDYQLVTVPGANHRLYLEPPEPAGMLAEVMQTEMHNVTIAPHVREQMVQWLSQHLS